MNSHKRLNKIAITGGIAEGKSTVVGLIRQAGYPVASADMLVAELYRDDGVQADLSALLGMPLPVEPQAVRDAILQDSTTLQSLNLIFHRRVFDLISSSDATFVEIPLLVESGLQNHFKQVWVVTCGPSEQLKRIEARSGTVQELDFQRRMLEFQLPFCARAAFADEIIRTNQPLDAVKLVVAECLNQEFIADALR